MPLNLDLDLDLKNPLRPNPPSEPMAMTTEQRAHKLLACLFTDGEAEPKRTHQAEIMAAIWQRSGGHRDDTTGDPTTEQKATRLLEWVQEWLLGEVQEMSERQAQEAAKAAARDEFREKDFSEREN